MWAHAPAQRKRRRSHDCQNPRASLKKGRDTFWLSLASNRRRPPTPGAPAPEQVKVVSQTVKFSSLEPKSASTATAKQKAPAKRAPRIHRTGCNVQLSAGHCHGTNCRIARRENFDTRLVRKLQVRELTSIRLLFCGSNHNASIRDAAFFTPLQVNGTGHFFVTVERTTRDARNFLVVDDGLAVLHDGDGSPD